MIFAAIAGGLMKLGLGRSVANRAAPFVFALALLALLGAGFAIWLHFHDRAVVEQHVTTANNKTLKRTIEANETSASERLSDEQTLETMRRSYDDALNNPPHGASPDPRKRLACERLRRAGYREADLPASCGRAGAGDGRTAADTGDR